MRREEFDHLIRAVGDALGRSEIIVIGSQSILGARPDVRQFPERLVMSTEVDFLPAPDPDELLADQIDSDLGELSQFFETYGVYAEGVSMKTAKLSPGWEGRLVSYETEATNGVVARCLDPHDLAAAKLIAGRDHDYDFCRVLLLSGFVSPDVVRVRLTETPDVDPAIRDRAVLWLGAQDIPEPAGIEVDQQRALEQHRQERQRADPAAPSGDIPAGESRTQGRRARGGNRARS